MDTTLISKLHISETDEHMSNIDIDNDNIDDINDFLINVNGDIPITYYIDTLNKFFHKFGESPSTEMINRLSTMYQFSGTKILEKIFISNFYRV